MADASVVPGDDLHLSRPRHARLQPPPALRDSHALVVRLAIALCTTLVVTRQIRAWRPVVGQLGPDSRSRYSLLQTVRSR